MNIDEFNKLCQNFAVAKQNIMRQGGLDTIRKALIQEDSVIIITASIENWVKPFFKEFENKIQIEGTQIDVRLGIVTGNFFNKKIATAKKK